MARSRPVMRQPDQMKGGELYLEQVEWVLKMWRVRQVAHHDILQEAVADEMGGQIDERLVVASLNNQ